MSQKNRSVPDKRFSLETVLDGDSSYLIAQIRSEVSLAPVSNGSQVRIKTLLQLCELLENLNRKMDQLGDRFLDFKEKKDKI